MLNLKQIKIKVEEDSNDSLISKISSSLRIDKKIVKDLLIIKKSIDARDKNQIYYVYECNFSVDNEDKVLNKNSDNPNLSVACSLEYSFISSGEEELDKNIVIVGCGPSGLFCSYVLLENGYKPILIERGDKIEDRISSVEEFWKFGKLNENSNVLFGEGGAGTFSDGKLNTLVKDSFNRGRHAFEIFVECGAPKEIMYDYKPHIGTDKLRKVVKNMREKIISMGGVIRFNTCLTDIITKDGKVEQIEVNNNELIDCSVVVLAIGHSARDTFKLLNEKGFNMSSKPFAVGVRVSHNQEMINESQYGMKYKDILPPATYKLTYQTKEKRGVYSFCMCPGGYVVNSSSEKGMLVVNGMSNYKRESSSSNSAIVVTVSDRDYGDKLFDGVEFQRKLEKKAYEVGNGLIPVQTLKGFYENKKEDFGKVLPVVKGKYSLSNLNEVLPSFVSDSIKEAMPEFDNKIKGFNNPDTLLFGVETRTSSPIKIYRNEEFVSNIEGIYPCGEGCGYAGGITSAAIDGIKIAEAIGKKYRR